MKLPKSLLFTVAVLFASPDPGTSVDAAVADGDARAIAGDAHAASAGRDLPRSFSTAYVRATLASEASDEAMTLWIDGGMGSIILAANTFASNWCPDNNTFAEFSFTLENGKTVSICENADSSDLTYFYGVPGKAPELEYRGPLLGTIDGISGFSHDLAGLGDYGFGEPSVEVDVTQEAVAAAAAARDTKGFFLVTSMGCCGGEETTILFRRGGWEYAVRIGYSRNVNPDVASETGDYSEWTLISLISPEGQNYNIR